MKKAVDKKEQMAKIRKRAAKKTKSNTLGQVFKAGVMGRPRKYTNVEDFMNDIVEYLDGFSKTYYAKARKPSKAGLRVYLNFTRDTVMRYENGERDTKPEKLPVDFSDTIKRAHDIIENEWVQMLPFGGSGVIFYLKNGFGYRDERNINRRELTKEMTPEEAKEVEDAFKNAKI